MANKAERAQLALRVWVERNNSCGERYFHVRASVRQLVKGSWDHPADTYDPVNGWRDLGFIVTSQGDERSQREAATRGDGGLYGWDVEYRELFSAGLQRVVKLHDTLKRLDRGLKRLQEARGYARSFGQYVGRVAEVIGAETILVVRKGTPQAAWMGENSERVCTVGEGVNAIDHIVQQWAAEATQDAADLAKDRQTASA